jgi:hypothetical protein
MKCRRLKWETHGEFRLFEIGRHGSRKKIVTHIRQVMIIASFLGFVEQIFFYETRLLEIAEEKECSRFFLGHHCAPTLESIWDSDLDSFYELLEEAENEVIELRERNGLTR